ncbi:MAG: lycopene cyclase domain-containing protein, partial [Candidatus Omnitrophota bacterium]
MMAYLFINLCVVSVPLALSFEKRVKYYRKFPALFSAILSVGAIYILWDIFASARGDWSFNERYILGGRFLGVPLEEVLFFIVVPYSCLFIYEVCLYFFKDHQVRISSINFIFLALVFGLLACFNRERGYTFAVLVFCSLSFFLTLLIAPGILR